MDDNIKKYMEINSILLELEDKQKDTIDLYINYIKNKLSIVYCETFSTHNKPTLLFCDGKCDIMINIEDASAIYSICKEQIDHYWFNNTRLSFHYMKNENIDEFIEKFAYDICKFLPEYKTKLSIYLRQKKLENILKDEL